MVERVSRRLLALLAALLPAALLAASAAPLPNELDRLHTEAMRVSIVRDDWGIAHIHGHSDADAVFGMIYAQAEDDFPRIEANYLTSLGRTAEVDGESALWADLRQRMFVDPERLQALYRASPADLQRLMQGWADGLNYYLATHPAVKPRVLTRFEPWMALSFTEGSIGGDISKVSLDDLQRFYAGRPSAPVVTTAALPFVEPAGSNGAAISPANTANGHALLLINPHTSFYFRSEAQVASNEGLNVYGAATWGQFFVYQGFNAHAGWMHTTSSADCVDEFAEDIVERGGEHFYRYGSALRPVTEKTVVLRYRATDGTLASRAFIVFATHHGPVVRAEGGKWIATALMDRPVAALRQSFGRTKAVDLAGFVRVARLAANSSNDTLFADDRGETAFLLPQFIPKRDVRFDYTRPVDGADPATDWQGVLSFAATPHIVLPATGWVYNSNDGPWQSAGAASPKQQDFPHYVDQVGDNARTAHSVRVFGGRHDFTAQRLIDAAFDRWLPVFDRLIPNLDAAYAAETDQRVHTRLAEPMALLRGWDRRWSASSEATSLAIFWAEALWARAVHRGGGGGGMVPYTAMLGASGADKLATLDEAVTRLEHDFGGWRISWGNINRFQRLDAAIAPHFDDSRPSVAVPFASAQWGSLASFGAKRYPNTKRYYGTSGNSFVAVVEFGSRVHARAVMAGGQSGDPASRHFADQVGRYAVGDLRDVYFYPDDLAGHVERRYRPGE